MFRLPIFLTISDEYAVEAFAMNATHYLLKPFSQEQFNAAPDRAVKKTEGQDLLSLKLPALAGFYLVNVLRTACPQRKASAYPVSFLSAGSMAEIWTTE